MVGVTDVRAFFRQLTFFFVWVVACVRGGGGVALNVCVYVLCVDVRGCVRESSARCNFSPSAW